MTSPLSRATRSLITTCATVCVLTLVAPLYATAHTLPRPAQDSPQAALGARGGADTTRDLLAPATGRTGASEAGRPATGPATPDPPFAPPVAASTNPVRNPAPAPSPATSLDQVARDVIAGVWGSGEDRRARLTRAGYDYDDIQARVNAIATPPRATGGTGGTGSSGGSGGPVADEEPPSWCQTQYWASTSVHVGPGNPGLPAECVTITGGSPSQRAAVRSYVAAYGTYTWIKQIALVDGLAHLGMTTGCSTLTPLIQLRASMGGTQLKMVAAHEISHAITNYIYGGCDYSMGALADRFGGYEPMTDCMAQALTGSTANLYYRPDGCAPDQVALARQMVTGHTV